MHKAAFPPSKLTFSIFTGTVKSETVWSETIVSGGGGYISQYGGSHIDPVSSKTFNWRRFWVCHADGREREVTCSAESFSVRPGHIVHIIDVCIGKGSWLLALANQVTEDLHIFDSVVGRLLSRFHRFILKPIKAVLLFVSTLCALGVIIGFLFVIFDRDVSWADFFPWLLGLLVPMLLAWLIDRPISRAENDIRDLVRRAASETMRRHTEDAAKSAA